MVALKSFTFGNSGLGILTFIERENSLGGDNSIVIQRHLRVTSCDIHRVILVVFQNAGYQPIR
jgi:hypothetical protein